MSSSRVNKRSYPAIQIAAAFFILFLFSFASFATILQFSEDGTSDNHQSIPARISAANGNGTVEIFMHWDGVLEFLDNNDVMNTFGPFSPGVIDYDDDGQWGVTIQKQPPKNYHYFVLSPAAADDIHILGNATFYYWARSSSNNSLMNLELRLYDSIDQIFGGDILIGSISILDQNFLIDEMLYNLTITSMDYILPTGNFLIVYFERNDNVKSDLRLAFDQSFLDTNVVIDIYSHLNDTDYWTTGYDGSRKSIFTNQENVNAFANISDAFGSYDIFNATIKVIDLSDLSIDVDSEMTVSQIDPSPLSKWKLFSESIGPLPVGNYLINITAIDRSGNSVNIAWTITVITVDHFSAMPSRTSLRADESFNITVQALDNLDQRLENWSGQLTISAIDATTGLPLSWLSNTSIYMSMADKGIINVTEDFTTAPKNIRIRVINGSATGESQNITILPGRISAISLNPDNISIAAGQTITIDANGTDKYGNINTSWIPFWELQPPNGTLLPYGHSVDLTGQSTGSAILYCTDNSTGVNVSANVTISTAGLARIEVVPDSGTIYERSWTNIHAYGYDAFDNVVDITGAIWSVQGFTMSTITGSGNNGQIIAGTIPETGTVTVSFSGISGSAQISVVTPSWGPSLGALPNQIGLEDTPWSIDLAVYWQDINGTTDLTWFISNVNDSLLIIRPDAHKNSIVEFIPQINAFGMDDVTFWVRDRDGYTNFKEITVNIRPVNDAPVFIHDPPTELYVKFALPYTFDYTYYVQDVDNSYSQLTLTANPSTFITSNGLNLTYNFPDLFAGQAYFNLTTLILSDGSPQKDTLNIQIWATQDTPPDLITPLPDVEIEEGQMNYEAFDLDDYFEDLDGDVLYFSKGYEYVEIEILTGTNLVLISSPSEWSGQTNAVFTAQDPTGAIRIDTIVITVTSVPDPPAILEMEDIHVHYDVMRSIDLRLYVSDPDNDLEELTITTSDPTHVQCVYFSYLYPYTHLEILYPPNLGGGPYVGPYVVTLELTVVDTTNLTAKKTFNVTVSDNYPPEPTDTDFPEFIIFNEDSYFRMERPLEDYFKDNDGDTLTFTWERNVSVIVTIDDDDRVNFSAPANWNGYEVLLFKATDPRGAWLSFLVRVDVTPINDPPVLLQIPDQEHYGGRQWSLDIRTFITDVEDPELSDVEIIVIEPSYVQVVKTTLFFNFPDDVNLASVIVYVSDGEDDSDTITFHAEIKYTIAEMIGYPWSLLIVLIIAGIIGYIISQRMLPHELQEIFIIHNDGRLINHSGADSLNGMDEDVVSAMFTAVQEFIKDSFRDSPEGLKTLQIGDKKIVIEKGKWIYAAMIYTGWPPRSVFKEFGRFLQDIEKEYGRNLEKWDGTMRKLFGIQAVSQAMLQKKYRTDLVKDSIKKAEAAKKAEKESVTDDN